MEKENSAMERQIALLESLLTEARIQRMRQVLSTRSDHVAFVFERMIDPHNFSAALRTLDALSFQEVHLVRPGERLEFSRGITIGTERWLSLHEAPTTEACLEGLKADGYRVLASHLEGDSSLALDEIDFSQRTALVFGNEHQGVGEAVLRLADARFRIPMLGFAQSFNLSVSVALSAFHARREIQRLAGSDPHPERFLLAPRRRRELYFHWLRRSVKNVDQVLAGLESAAPEPEE